MNIKLTDFGFACFYDKDKGLDTSLGTPYYMAPEIIKKEKYGSGVDVWAVGIVAHILLTGMAPFAGNTRDRIKHKILTAT